MKWLNQIPLLRLVIPYALGIIYAFYFPYKVDVYLLITLAIVFLCNIMLINLKRINSNYYFRWIFGVFITIFFFLLGFIIANSKIEKFDSSHFSKSILSNTSPSLFIATLSSEPETKENSIKAIVEINNIKINGKLQKCSGKCLVYFKKSTQVLKYGDVITFNKTPSNISPPANFNEFNYKQFLSHHHIYQRVYLSSLQFQVIGYEPLSIFKENAIKWRNKLLNRYKEYGIENNELAIISALTLGKKESLTKELKSAYSSAGAMHVLAVSGLHVGIVYLVIQFLLGWMNKIKYGMALKAIILLLSIWLYAFITGLSPSVIRAATMFSFILIATSFKRKSNIYNTLALSALAILTYKPFMLLEVGFQLSYLAVIGIIYLHPHLYQMIKTPSGIIDKAWSITCVSLSAQIATAPLGILYFHQFPSYFLISNLIVIPAAFIIIFLAIAFQALSFIPFVGKLISWLLLGLVSVLNWIVSYIENLPHSLITGLDISTIETWVLYTIIGSITIWLTLYQRKFALITLGAIIALTTTQTIEKWNQLNQKEITFYNTGRQTAIEYINGKELIFHGDLSLVENEDRMLFQVYHHWWNRGYSISDFETKYDTNTHKTAIILGNTRILKLENIYPVTKKQIELFEPHLLYINTYKPINLNNLTSIPLNSIIILGTSASKNVKLKIKEFGSSRNIQVIDIDELGSIKITLTKNLTPQKISYQKLR